MYPSFSQQGVCRWQKELLLCKQGVTISKIMNASFIVRSLEILLSWNPINPTIHLRCLVIQSWGAAKDGSSVKFSNWGVYWLPLGKWCLACQNEKNQEFLAIQNLLYQVFVKNQILSWTPYFFSLLFGFGFQITFIEPQNCKHNKQINCVCRPFINICRK